ncbi:MAG TPA: ligase [Ramlibacter sp.]|nr:ligase [Ramlibacter sp.]
MTRPPIVHIHVRPGRSPIIVLGAAQRELRTDGSLPVRVRSSGGGAVLSGPWLLRASVVMPRSHPLARHGPAVAARWYGEIHCGWLQAQGITSAAVYRGPAVDHWACFAGRVAGEVVVGERKIVGIAQAWRTHTVLMSSGTLIAPVPWTFLCRSLGRQPEVASSLAADTIDAQDCLRQPVDVRAWADDLLRLLRAGVAREME